jgi:hypothetical protein
LNWDYSKIYDSENSRYLNWKNQIQIWPQ